MKTILAVDDSATIRQMTGMVLREEGYEVIEAENGEDALTKLRGRTLGLILTDVNMPKMDGLEFTRRLRAMEEYKFVPVVLLTTETQPEKRLQRRGA